jgi:hypothetical protein
LGKRVVKRLRIVIVRKLAHGDRSLRPPEDLSALESNRRDWPRRGPGKASAMPELIGRSRVKYFGRKRGKVH